MIRIMRLWKDGTITNIGLFTSAFWAERYLDTQAQLGKGTWGKRLWIEDEKHPATKEGHS